MALFIMSIIFPPSVPQSDTGLDMISKVTANLIRLFTIMIEYAMYRRKVTDLGVRNSRTKIYDDDKMEFRSKNDEAEFLMEML